MASEFDKLVDGVMARCLVQPNTEDAMAIARQLLVPLLEAGERMAKVLAPYKEGEVEGYWPQERAWREAKRKLVQP